MFRKLRIPFISGFLLSVTLFLTSCFTGGIGGSDIHLFQQALDISVDLVNTVHFILPNDSDNGTYYFTDEYEEGSNGGSIEYSGTYTYHYDGDYYGYTIEKNWSGFTFTFDDYTSLNGLTVESGELSVHGDYKSVSGVSPLGHLYIEGTVTVSGSYEDENIRDTITVDFDCLWKQMIDDGSTLANRNEEWDIWEPYY